MEDIPKVKAPRKTKTSVETNTVNTTTNTDDLHINKLNIGCHIHKDKNYITSIDTVIKNMNKLENIKLHNIQIFATGPRSYFHTMTDADILAIIAAAKSGKFNAADSVIHGGYFDHPYADDAAPKIISNMNYELEVAEKLGFAGVVIHLPKKSPEIVLSGLQKIKIPKNTRIILEMESYHSSPDTYETPDKAAALFNLLIKHFPVENLGFCIDSAHLFSAGVKINTYAEVIALLDEFKAKLPPNLFMMLHLNDQYKEFASGKDEHAELTYGNIWRDYNPEFGTKKYKDSGLYAFITWMTKEHHPMILERKSELLIKDLQIIHDIQNLDS